jgi:excinuclease UvrABC nuclease subunit
MRDAADQVIYVGKAKNLNRRVRSYYSQPLGLTRKMDGLLEAISRIEVEVLGSELEALLRESRLIKELLPRYNIQQRYYQHYPFIRIDRQLPYPRIVATRSVTDDGARYFGPFRNAQAVTTTIELLTDLFPVRTCTNKISRPEQRWRACLRLDLGQCLGPCVGQTDVVTYQRLIDDIIAYLDGRREPLVERLWQQLRQASDRLDFERAARLRDAIGHVSQVTIGQHLLTAAVAGSHYLIVQPSAIEAARELLLIVAGRLACQLTLPASADHQPIAAHLYTAWQTASAAHQPDRPVDQASLDEIAIISRWLAQHHGSPAILDLPQPADDSAGWQRLIADLPPLAALAPAGRSPRAAPVAPELIDRFYEES